MQAVREALAAERASAAGAAEAAAAAAAADLETARAEAEVMREALQVRAARPQEPSCLQTRRGADAARAARPRRTASRRPRRRRRPRRARPRTARRTPRNRAGAQPSWRVACPLLRACRRGAGCARAHLPGCLQSEAPAVHSPVQSVERGSHTTHKMGAPDPTQRV